MIKSGGNRVIASIYRGKGERNECSNYIGISLLSEVAGSGDL